MHKLNPDQYSQAAPLFAELAVFHLSAASILAGTARGQVWVESIESPRVGFLIGPEGYYLAGDPQREECFSALKEIIPIYAYLIFHPATWETKLEQVWVNRVARRHPRLRLLFQDQRIPNFRELVPEGY
jgi:hypothetical protein